LVTIRDITYTADATPRHIDHGCDVGVPEKARPIDKKSSPGPPRKPA
jgi:hypothetical protein